MKYFETCLLLCSVFSAIIVSEVSSQGVVISVSPAKPSLTDPIFINCTADVLSKKIQSFSIYRGKEEILTFDPSSRPRVQWSDESLKSRFTFYKTLKKQTILSLELKSPRCTDQNVYKCMLSVKKQGESQDEKRIDFYVPSRDPQDVTLMYEGMPEVGQEMRLNCSGKVLSAADYTISLYKRTEMNTQFHSLAASVIDENRMNGDSNCMSMVYQVLSYKPTQEDKGLEVMCRISADGKAKDAMQVIDVKGLFIVPTGIPVEKPDQHETMDPTEEDGDEHSMEKDNDEDMKDMDEKEDGDDDKMDGHMTMDVTVAPEPKEEKEKGEMEAEKEKDKMTDKVKTQPSKGGENSSSMLKAFSVLVLSIAFVVMV
ncbi:uncharacterized protein LOC115221428 isoform X3 [Argonauta hians]